MHVDASVELSAEEGRGRQTSDKNMGRFKTGQKITCKTPPPRRNKTRTRDIRGL